MYTQNPAPQALGVRFSTLSTWRTEGASWSGTLAADPGFEIAWSLREGRIDGRPRLTPATRRVATLHATNGPQTIRVLRFRHEWVGPLFGGLATELADGNAVDLGELGPVWRTAAAASTEGELFDALSRGSTGMTDPLVLTALDRLREPRPTAYGRLAYEAGYSYEQWRRRMRAAIGVSPKFLARYFRLQGASRLARSNPTMSMAEIAFRTGFGTDCLLASEAASLSGRTFRALVQGYTLPE